MCVMVGVVLMWVYMMVLFIMARGECVGILDGSLWLLCGFT